MWSVKKYNINLINVRWKYVLILRIKIIICNGVNVIEMNVVNININCILFMMNV